MVVCFSFHWELRSKVKFGAERTVALIIVLVPSYFLGTNNLVLEENEWLLKRESAI